MPSELYGRQNPELVRKFPVDPVQETIVSVMSAYLHLYHRLEVNFHPDTPKQGPYIALTSHFSLLDTMSLMAADPYHPRTSLVVKEKMMRTPFFGKGLVHWGAIPVNRDGTDTEAIRRVLEVLDKGNGICIAAQGTRSTDGHLWPMDRSLVNLSLLASARGVPVFPIVELGTYEALPKGSFLPKPHKIRVITGPPVDLNPWNRNRKSGESLIQAATIIQKSIADLLPEERRPLPESGVIWTYKDYAHLEK